MKLAEISRSDELVLASFRRLQFVQPCSEILPALTGKSERAEEGNACGGIRTEVAPQIFSFDRKGPFLSIVWNGIPFNYRSLKCMSLNMQRKLACYLAENSWGQASSSVSFVRKRLFLQHTLNLITHFTRLKRRKTQ